MADIGANLIADLLNSTDARLTVVGDRVQQGTVNINDTNPRVWIGRGGGKQGSVLGGKNGVVREEWDVECVTDIEENDNDGLLQAENLADAIKERWDSIKSSSNIPLLQGIFVDDHEDDFIPNNTGGADGPYVAALQVVVWRNST